MNTLALVVWMYISANGTFCYAGDIKDVPSRYRESAKQIEIGPLADYSRLTIVESN